MVRNSSSCSCSSLYSFTATYVFNVHFFVLSALTLLWPLLLLLLLSLLKFLCFYSCLSTLLQHSCALKKTSAKRIVTASSTQHQQYWNICPQRIAHRSANNSSSDEIKSEMRMNTSNSESGGSLAVFRLKWKSVLLFARVNVLSGVLILRDHNSQICSSSTSIRTSTNIFIRFVWECVFLLAHSF